MAIFLVHTVALVKVDSLKQPYDEKVVSHGPIVEPRGRGSALCKGLG